MDERTADGPIASPAPPGPNPAATVVAPAGKPAQPAQPSGESSVRETIESILVAFILAFIFRAFIVEAFVIPTGSMAPTLLGAHIRFDCDDCGYRFDANYRAANTPDGKDVIIPAKAGPNGPYKRIEKRKHKVIEKVVEN